MLQQRKESKLRFYRLKDLKRKYNKEDDLLKKEAERMDKEEMKE